MSATDALELGIDIGLLDCVISTGFPGTVASLRQQWGRAGRRGHGLAVLVATEDALDQYFMREPETLLGRRVEAAILDHANPRVLDGHVRAAAFEAPIDDADRDVLGDEALERAALLPELRAHAGRLRLGRPRLPGRPRPAALDEPGLRSPSIDTADGSVLGLVERERAYSTVHEGAVYLHLGQVVPRPGARPRRPRRRWSRRSTATCTRRRRRTRRPRSRSRSASSARLGLELTWGRVSVTEQVVAYQLKKASTQETLDLVSLDLPETTFETEAIWFCPEPWMLEDIDRMPTLLGSLHAAEHALIALLPLWAMCDRWDIGGLSTNVHFQTGRPTIFVYDGHPGGVGITERGFEAFEGWVGDTAKLLAGCPCEHGCPSCVQSPKCGNLNDMLDKAGARSCSSGCCRKLAADERAVPSVAVRLRRHGCTRLRTASGRASRPARARAARRGPSP